MFVIASMLCGLAPSIEVLIAFRVLQGFVAGPMIPLSQTLLLSTYPPAKAGTALALWGVTTLVAPVAGPLAGRLHHRQLDVALDLLHQHPGGHLRRGRDVEHLQQARDRPASSAHRRHRAGMLMLWVGSLQVMLDKGKELDWFNSNTIVALAVVVVIAFWRCSSPGS
jgi:DHA2 family multidrug resistance protein